MAERYGKGEKLTLVEWLGYRKDSNFENNRGLGIAFGFVLFFLALLLGLLAIASVFLLIAVVFKLFLSIPDADLGNALRGIAFALGAIVGLPFLVWRSWVGHRQADTAAGQHATALKQAYIAEQGLITDRFTKAVEQLGADKIVRDKLSGNEETVPNIEVRLGALYALERIAQDSERDHIPIMETICAYIRENTKEARFVDPENRAAHLKYDNPRVEIQTALDILGRREKKFSGRLALEVNLGYRLDFGLANLQCCELDELDFSGANFGNTKLDGASLNSTNLKGASFLHASLDQALFCGAIVDHKTRFHACSVKSLAVKGTDFSNSRELEQSQVDQMFGDATTVIPSRLNRPNWSKQDLTWKEYFAQWPAHIKKHPLTPPKK